jgi:quercetin dioxygenase-like cupin family protein
VGNKVVAGNAAAEGEAYRGWFLGHFLASTEDLRFTNALEIKWTTHPAGEMRSRWAVSQTATTISILIRGQFRLTFPDGDVILSQEGDYALWQAGTPHGWIAEDTSTIVTIR